MFISNKEKDFISTRLDILEARVKQLTEFIHALHDAKTMASDPSPVQHKQSASRRAYARAYYQRKKYEKLVQEQKA